MTNTEVIPEDNWKEIEVIGWLYQYYIAEEKDQVFANLKKNIKITKDTLPAATQLFTPSWIVRYMVENSLGRIWIESYPDSHLRSEWKHYLDEAEQEESVIKQLEEIRYKNVNPEEITFLDPCCGSGHILVYAFDVFYDMYLEKGYVESEIPQLIIEKNLFGLDVDDRAAQLASFAVMMKARGKSRRIFRQSIQPNIYPIQESNWLTNEMISKASGNDNRIEAILTSIRDNFLDAKEYGSTLDIEPFKYELLVNWLNEYINEEADLVEMIDKQIIEHNLPLLLKQSSILSDKYDVVCTNPPYMGNGSMNSKLSSFLKDKYPNTKSDMSTVFMEKTLQLCKPFGKIAMINIPVWMFIKSYLNLRKHLIENKTIINMLHLGRGVFGSDFGTTAFVISNAYIDKYNATYRKLYKKHGGVDSIDQKEQWFFEDVGLFTAQQTKYSKIPGAPIAYWVTDKIFEIYDKERLLGSISEPRQGLITGDNDRFLKLWHEVSMSNTSLSGDKSKKWYPINKGGEFRRWYGNNQYVVNWENGGFEIKNFKNEKGKLRSRPQNLDYNFKKSVSWSLVTIGAFSARYYPENSLFNVAGISCFPDEDSLEYILGLLNTKLAQNFTQIINPTINMNAGDVANIPVIVSKEDKPLIEKLVSRNIEISKNDWDSFEISWDFKSHPLLKFKDRRINHVFNNWDNYTQNQFNELKENEEELNRIFNKIYGLENELSPEVDVKEVTVHKADLEREIRSFISYAIGCSFGRYSLDEEGLVYAGGEFNPSQYKTFQVDQDNILPILPGAYFKDDIVSRFIDFVQKVFGEDNLAENLDFVADALGRKKGETAKETVRRYFLNDFYKEHVKTYNKRPIYWLFTSGKEKAFNCLIYMHHYDKTTLSRIRTDYLHDYQISLDAEKKDLLNIIEGDSTAKEISNAKKELKSLDKKIEELKAYDELLHHMADMQIEIDLDDGVKVNYEKFKGLVAKI